MLVSLVLVFLIFNLAFIVSAAEGDTDADSETDPDADTEADSETDPEADTTITPVVEIDLSGADKGFECLADSVDGKCSSLSFEEKVFTVLAIGECKDELKSESEDNKCWPKSSCNVKDTALAIWALSNRNIDTEDAENWILSQNSTPEEVSWFLEIESSEEARCEVSYSGSEYTVILNEDKTISADAGSCLSKSVGNYWLRVSPSCYDKEFEVSCDKGFLTTLLYKRRDSSVIHVSESTHDASAEGRTSEKVNSVCFSNGGVCDYEGSLWASLILDSRTYADYDISPYLPYLVTMADQNERLLPEAFLYLMLDHADFRNDLLLKQRGSKYWDESGNKFYDTALALLPFPGSSVPEKQGSVEWLLEVQDESGCFNNENKRDTAFLLYSLWLERAPASTDDDGDSALNCEVSGNYCLSSPNCEASNVLDYDGCAGVFVCCSVPLPPKTCEGMLGQVCNSNQICVGSGSREDNSADDLSYGQTCCISGVCEIGAREEEATCEGSGYTCKELGCGTDEEEVSYETCDFSATCCRDIESETTSYLWLWIVLISLIILVIVAIVFRDKLRPYWSKLTGGKGKPPAAGLPGRPSSAFGRPAPGMRPRPGMRPAPARPGMRPAQGRPMQKRTLPMRRPAPRINPRAKPRPELNQTLNKLRDMNKK
ncbi:hypothetical protein KAR91_74540 [Candidatus Pacearchaeota archaeon]|nr:hypothetical protein [Candidatus Pacearchaeota archaeon]